MEYVENIKSSFDELSKDLIEFRRRHFIKHDVEKTLSSIRGKLWTYYPFLFFHAFVDKTSINECEKIRILNTTSLYYYLQIMYTDRICDENLLEDKSEIVMISNYLQVKALEGFYSIFSGSSSFWCMFREYHDQYIHAVLDEEHKYVGSYKTHTKDDQEYISAGKCAMAKLVTAALCVLHDENEYLSPITLSQDYFHVAFQIQDDIKDWRDDYKNQRYSYILSKVIETHNLVDRINSRNRPDAELIGKLLYFSGIAEDELNRCLDYYGKALSAVSDINCPEWKNLINERILKCKLDLEKIKIFVREHLTKYHDMND